ncbi:ORMDL protein [Ordospora pajunii]|uniref:ORMDL protein n=1 Tax=Ordospora pajunii TaxID=3039483 RepID=UPI00295279EF|nr:ORMDL protein [Ordospora pajunii]KAH9410640.1 ORMDL protein [Ordospora pajunii]
MQNRISYTHGSFGYHIMLSSSMHGHSYSALIISMPTTRASHRHQSAWRCSTFYSSIQFTLYFASPLLAIMASNRPKNVDISQSIAWTPHKSSWLIHPLALALIHLTLSIAIDPNTSLQLALIIYNISTFILFHMIPGIPFNNRYSTHTFWEQLSEQLESSPGLIFISIFPIIAFFTISLVVYWRTAFLYACIASLALVIIPKFGFMHLKRMLSISK